MLTAIQTAIPCAINTGSTNQGDPGTSSEFTGLYWPGPLNEKTLTITGKINTDIIVDWGDETTPVKHVCTGGADDITHDFGSGELPDCVLTITGAINTITTFEHNDTYFTGDISAFGSLKSLTYLKCLTNNLSGDIANLPSYLTTVWIIGTNTITGALSTAPSGLTYFKVAGNNTISGDLADTNTSATNLDFYGNNGHIDTYTVNHNFYSGIVSLRNSPDSGYGLSSTEVDDLLIDLDKAVMSSGAIRIDGENAARTSASDAAVSALTGRGVVITVNV